MAVHPCSPNSVNALPSFRECIGLAANWQWRWQGKKTTLKTTCDDNSCAVSELGNKGAMCSFNDDPSAAPINPLQQRHPDRNSNQSERQPSPAHAASPPRELLSSQRTPFLFKTITETSSQRQYQPSFRWRIPSNNPAARPFGHTIKMFWALASELTDGDGVPVYKESRRSRCEEADYHPSWIRGDEVPDLILRKPSLPSTQDVRVNGKEQQENLDKLLDIEGQCISQSDAPAGVKATAASILRL
ncbi:unnamed protein product [Zymoseptoria tritici ST99CH_1A5]|uniref:Uncharacterized protein n=1 Tax=Zymoseptoria tritici ST99CH_1A5 TaxID=1276529 RepID=A0A1Y6LRX2_ZYMTR|nr:unnamed protein product [Zymoseptoria tritici ST99CH_1A5]